MFDTLTGRLSDIFRDLRGRGHLNEADVDKAMREIRMALLEADVNYKVVKDFVSKVKDKAIGEAVLKSLTPGQQVVKVVHDELTELMGGAASVFTYAPTPPTIIMLMGLQGSGKTTTAAKLALKFKGDGKKVLMAAADIYRPAAVQQLVTLGKELSIDVFRGDEGETAVSIVKRSLETAGREGYGAVILDTAGRLHIDDEMMNELVEVKNAVRPHQVYFVADSMTGQDAVNQASAFNERVGFDGVILTKLDGDARGGAALSVKAVTDRPIVFVTVGEKPKDLEVFHPDRMADRILGMGDVLSLIEKAQATVDEQEAQAMAEKMLKEQFTLEDFLVQIDSLSKMGGLNDIIKMLPSGLAPKGLRDFEVSEKEMSGVKAIIQSMTPDERLNPKTINGSRRARIAKGSGTSVGQVNQLLKQFEMMKKMMKSMSGSKGKMRPGMRFNPFG